ncbi:probable calcium-binding protein CML41 [Henckelia pumila]|uniref:probable calcium-binding protein CML41 n=1 Tax=Henckelia pumila TaxID=405737 RepID=UPI003C6DD868
MAMISRIKSSLMGTKADFKLRLRLPGRLRPSTECPADDGGGSSGGGGVAITSKEDEYWRVFGYLDTNKDGKISANELRNYFSSVGDTVSDEEAKKIIREFSKGKGGGGGGEDSMRLEFGEFVRMAELRDSDEDKVVILRRAFEVYEVDKGSGFITPEGLRGVLRRLGDVKSYQECEAMIRTYDLDGNGALDFYEFQKMMS